MQIIKTLDSKGGQESDGENIIEKLKEEYDIKLLEKEKLD